MTLLSNCDMAVPVLSLSLVDIQFTNIKETSLTTSVSYGPVFKSVSYVPVFKSYRVKTYESVIFKYFFQTIVVWNFVQIYEIFAQIYEIFARYLKFCAQNCEIFAQMIEVSLRFMRFLQLIGILGFRFMRSLPSWFKFR